jgi:hypothetical protein
MKRKILSGLLGAALATAAHAQTATFYVNDGSVNCPPEIPPQIDALNFVNNNFFSINFTNLATLTQLYETANTLNFTNRGTMIGNNGFRFDTAPTESGLRRMANSFYNPGTITVGSINNTNAFGALFFGFFGLNFGLPQLVISATNVIDPGTNIVGENGLFQVTGRQVDLSRGVITLEGFENTPTNAFSNFFFNNEGIFTRYASVGSNVMVPASLFENFPPRTPTGLTLPGATFYARVSDLGFGTNLFVQAVFLSDTNAAVSNNVFFSGFQTVVEWSAQITNLATGSVFTNYLYLFDNFGFSGSNLLSAAGIPLNYSFRRSTTPLNLGAPATPTQPTGYFYSVLTTNEYAEWGATVAPTTALPGALPGDRLTNLPGRVEVSADDVLDLSRAKINGLNYLRLQSTNHFAGSHGAQITIPYSDISLGSTNGSLVLTNLLIPTVPRYNGEVDLWSGRWTNSDPVFTVYFHVLFVDSRLSPLAQTRVRDLYLRSTNMVLSDVMNVERSFLFDGENLTLTTNGPASQAASGEVNLLNTDITWSSATPRLKNLTNNGAIRTQNAIFFGGARTTPFFSTNFNESYLAMVNHGEISDQGTLIWANYFENTARISSGIGSLSLQSGNALLRDGSFLATNGDIAITSGTLTVTNHGLQAGRALSFTVTNLLDDGSVTTPVAAITNKNNWTAGDGINLFRRPARSSLLGTTITATAPALRQVISRWAGKDLDCSPAGFVNNAAVGRLILDGGADSLFTFSPVPLTLTFDAAAAESVPPAGVPVRSGVYQPSNYAPGRPMLTNGVPADVRALLTLPYANSLADFRGTNNLSGNWRLFIDDRTANYLGNYISWDWNLTVSVLSSNYVYTTNFVSINGYPFITGASQTTNYSAAEPAFVGPAIALPAGVPFAGAVAQPYPATNAVSLPWRNNQVVTNVFAVTNQIGPNVFVTNRIERVYTTDHVTNLVVSLSAQTVSFPADVDILLLGPQGQKVMLMAGAGALDATNRNALYVDSLEFRDYTTTTILDGQGNVANVQIDPNMKIYYAQALATDGTVAERINGANGGRFCWIRDYTGFYSTTNLPYPDGTLQALNTALVVNQNLDSDCDGLPNYWDTVPVLLITTASLPEATTFAPYSAPLQAFGGPANPYTWTLAPGSAALPAGLTLSTGGVLSGTPTQAGVFTFTVRVAVATSCGTLTADRSLSLTVHPGGPMLSVAIEHHSPPGARVSWQTPPNSMNYLYYRPSLKSGAWQLLTNFPSAAGGTVSVWDPVATNLTRYYRVQVNPIQP